MKSVTSLFTKNQPKTFRVTWASGYTDHIYHFILNDQNHPLYQAQKRRLRERKNEGLWLFVTSSVDLKKSSCVRSWARRRLRNAVGDELELRGYNRTGKLINQDTLKSRKDLTGSLRLHAQPALLSAKYEHVRAEVGQTIDTMLQGTKKPAKERPQNKSRFWTPK